MVSIAKKVYNRGYREETIVSGRHLFIQTRVLSSTENQVSIHNGLTSFLSRYLNLPFDLSQVVFIATANDASTIPTPLLDRMEVLEMPSYSSEQKFQIAARHIIPRQLLQHALSPDYLEFRPDAIHKIIESYTREAGVRQLERTIGAVCRWAAVGVAQAINGGQVETDTMSSELILPIVVKEEDLIGILGVGLGERLKVVLVKGLKIIEG
jgi:ATP-dependent Lon protease